MKKLFKGRCKNCPYGTKIENRGVVRCPLGETKGYTHWCDISYTPINELAGLIKAPKLIKWRGKMNNQDRANPELILVILLAMLAFCGVLLWTSLARGEEIHMPPGYNPPAHIRWEMNKSQIEEVLGVTVEDSGSFYFCERKYNDHDFEFRIYGTPIDSVVLSKKVGGLKKLFFGTAVRKIQANLIKKWGIPQEPDKWITDHGYMKFIHVDNMLVFKYIRTFDLKEVRK